MPNDPAHFIDFLLSARLGSLRCGLTTKEVEDLFGKPQIIEQYPNDAGLWSYGVLEVRFFGGRVDSFGIYFCSSRERVPGFVNPQGYFPNGRTGIRNIRRFLNDHKIAFELGRGGLSFRTNAGVW